MSNPFSPGVWLGHTHSLVMKLMNSDTHSCTVCVQNPARDLLMTRRRLNDPFCDFYLFGVLRDFRVRRQRLLHDSSNVRNGEKPVLLPRSRSCSRCVLIVAHSGDSPRISGNWVRPRKDSFARSEARGAGRPPHGLFCRTCFSTPCLLRWGLLCLSLLASLVQVGRHRSEGGPVKRAAPVSRGTHCLDTGTCRQNHVRPGSAAQRRW